MKKILATIIVLTLCFCLFTACKGKSTDDEATNSTTAEATISAEEFRSDEDFTGNYSNDAYTAKIVKDKSGELTVTITSVKQNNTSYEWTMSGYLSDINYKVIYDNAVKTVISYNSEGKEKSRETEYENGSGRIVFDDNNGFTWENEMESIESNTFTREK